MNKSIHIKRFDESNENFPNETSSVSAAKDDIPKKFTVEIICQGDFLFSDIIEANNLIDAADKAITIVGVERITSNDEVDINVKEINPELSRSIEFLGGIQ